MRISACAGGVRQVFIPATLCSIGILIFSESASAQYNRQEAVRYMSSWAWSSGQEPPPPNQFDTAVKTDHVNNSTFTWHYQIPRFPSLGRLSHAWGIRKILLYPVQTNAGDGTIPTVHGYDCANFVSQVLIAGGVNLAGGDYVPGSSGLPVDPLAKGGTYIAVKRLAAILPSISSVTTNIADAGSLPSDLAPGDVIQFIGIDHMVVVYSTGAALTYSGHTTDRLNEAISNIPHSPVNYWPATAFHITGTQTARQTDSTPPTVVPSMNSPSGATQFADGDVINGYSISVAAADYGAGLSSFYLTEGAPIIDGEQNVLYSTATVQFLDLSPRGSNFTYLLPDNLVDGIYFIEAFDAAGNASLTSFYLDRTSPSIFLLDSRGVAISSGGYTNSTAVTLFGNDGASGSGLQQLSITQLSGGTTGFSISFSTYATAPASSSLTGTLPDGLFLAQATDLAGNETSVSLCRFSV